MSDIPLTPEERKIRSAQEARRKLRQRVLREIRATANDRAILLYFKENPDALIDAIRRNHLLFHNLRKVAALQIMEEEKEKCLRFRKERGYDIDGVLDDLAKELRLK